MVESAFLRLTLVISATILSEKPESLSDEEIVSESPNSHKEEKEHQGETKKSWNSLRKVILLKSLDKYKVFNLRKLGNLPVEFTFKAADVFLRVTTINNGGKKNRGEELMLDYAISRLAPVQ
ncbi:PREDICTED: uncharacterized protein LOC104719960 [Camelina sativa]|uniref:Uncharacterized protein LOC104719960 n=1 Tax=Camelina sativa TaxID=90675 RepID=A0ABM0U5Q8_CAMSA|nr:PREDICTED: uncharacterized protein LOC104719960 [Camelina sativa]